MSEIANWSYTNTATITPFIARDKYGKSTYGEPYEIKCTWRAKAQQGVTPAGVQFITNSLIYTEDPRPKYLDMIQLNGSDKQDEIKGVGKDDMSMFAMAPDFILMTG